MEFPRVPRAHNVFAVELASPEWSADMVAAVREDAECAILERYGEVAVVDPDLLHRPRRQLLGRTDVDPVCVFSHRPPPLRLRSKRPFIAARQRASCLAQSKQRRLPVVLLGLAGALGRRAAPALSGRRFGSTVAAGAPAPHRLQQARIVVGHAVDRRRNLIGLEQILRRRHQQAPPPSSASTLRQSSQKSNASGGITTGMR